jgi:hypothetical protein
MKVVDLLNAAPILQRLADQKMPAKMAYALAKNFRLVNQEIEDYDQARVNILKANWKVDPETNQFKVPDKDQLKWKELHDELLLAEADFQPYLIDFTMFESIELTPGEVMALWFLFDNQGLG